jgi:hypoxanthine phosphoribosyltransferase
MCSVFISHSTADSDLAVALAQTFSKALIPNIRIVCTSSRDYTYPPGTPWNRQIPIDVAACQAHLALITPRGLGSTYFLMELGARWGVDKDIFPVVVPNVSLDQLRDFGFISNVEICNLADKTSVYQLISRLQEMFNDRNVEPSRYYQKVDSVVNLAEKYNRVTPIPIIFDRTENPRRLSADQIVAGADRFLANKMPMRDGFSPNIVIGINSGGTFAASVFSERRSEIKLGTIWTKRASSGRALDMERTFLPEASTDSPRVLLIDSKMGTGKSVRSVFEVVLTKYGEAADIRLLVTLVYGGWEREDIDFPDQYFWPARFTLGEMNLKMYAMYYTDRDKIADDIEEPGKPPRRA